uniref:Glycoprotein V platelet n=1 Tax=Anser brachyrhynchus TaxID=132585 RepID=A0A8B9CE69_9AVES
MLMFHLSVMIKLFFQLDASVCPEKCDCSFKNAIHCSGPHIKDLESLNLPRNVTEIHITNTNVTYLQDVFSRMVELQHLILSSNNITLISPVAFKGLRRLKALGLLDNKLVELPPEVFDDAVHLRQLIIKSNRLKSIKENLFDRLASLEELFLNKNQLTALPSGVNIFSALTRLEKLILYFNRLSSIESELLVLSFNPELSVLPRNAFSGLKELLEFLPRNLFHNLKHLQKVYLNSTKLQSLPGDFFVALPELQEVFLDGNPWRCDCQILGFQEWLQKSKEIVKEVQSLVCRAWPPALLSGLGAGSEAPPEQLQGRPHSTGLPCLPLCPVLPRLLTPAPPSDKLFPLRIIAPPGGFGCRPRIPSSLALPWARAKPCVLLLQGGTGPSAAAVLPARRALLGLMFVNAHLEGFAGS